MITVKYRLIERGSMSELVIGIVGAGKLGSVLAEKLAKAGHVLVCDKNSSRSLEVSSLAKVKQASVKEVVAESSYIFLALPPNEVTGFCVDMEKEFKSDIVILNLATSLDTKAIKESMHRNDIQIIGVKPICQSSALRNGSKIKFIISEEFGKLEELRRMVKDMGDILLGNEMKVQLINEYATLRALELIIQVEDDMKKLGVEQSCVDTAIRTVALGTLMDYPYKNKNQYISNLVNKYNLSL